MLLPISPLLDHIADLVRSVDQHKHSTDGVLGKWCEDDADDRRNDCHGDEHVPRVEAKYRKRDEQCSEHDDRSYPPQGEIRDASAPESTVDVPLEYGSDLSREVPTAEHDSERDEHVYPRKLKPVDHCFERPTEL